MLIATALQVPPPHASQMTFSLLQHPRRPGHELTASLCWRRTWPGFLTSKAARLPLSLCDQDPCLP
jgi:hypothetical protein